MLKTTPHQSAAGMNATWRKMCRFPAPLIHDLSKYVRSPLDLDPYSFTDDDEVD